MKHTKESKETLSQSVSFSSLGTIVDKAAALLGFLILARLLSPNEFGLLAIISIFTSLSMIFIEMGMGAALIYTQGATDKHFETAFWFNLGIGLLLCLAMMMLAPFVASFFREPNATRVIAVSAVLLPMNALSLVPHSIIQKSRQFRSIAKVQVISTISGVVLAVILAHAGFGVWSLVSNLFVRSTVKAILTFKAAGWRPHMYYGRNEFGELWSYSSYLMLSSIVEYLVANTDKFLIARSFNSSTLGTYDYANKLTVLPSNVIIAVLGRVLFPTYASVEISETATKNLHIRVLCMVAFITFPLMMLISAFADQLVLTVIGGKWFEAIFALKIFGFIYLFRTVGAINGTLYLSQGATKLQFKITLLLRLNVLVAIIVGIQFGINGLLIALLIVRIVNLFPALYFPGRLIGISFIDIVRSLMPAFTASGIAYLSVIQLKQIVAYNPQSPVALAVGVMFFLTIYLLSLALVNPDYLLSHVRQVREILKWRT